MQETKRRSKKGVILLALTIALLVLAFVPSAMASPTAPNVLVPDFDSSRNLGPSAWGNWGQGNHYWFGPDKDYIAADFGAIMNTVPMLSWTGIPIAAPYSGTLDVGSYKWNVNGLPVGQEVDPVAGYPTTQYFGDTNNATFSWALSDLPMNDGIYTLSASLKETTATVNANVQKATATTDFGVDNTDPEWVHVVDRSTDKAIDEDCYYNEPVKFSAIAQDPYGSGVAPTPTAVWEPLGNPINSALGYQLDWDRYIYEITGTVNPPPRPYEWDEVTNTLVLTATDTVGNAYSEPWNVNFDLEPPITDYTVDPVGSDDQAGWTNKPVTVTFNAADGHPRPNSGIDYTEYIVKTTSTTTPPTFPGINESGMKGDSVVIDQTAPIGPTYVYFRSVDNACPTGNKEAWNLVRIFFDDVAPALSDNTPDWWINKHPFLAMTGEAIIEITASDHNSGLVSPGITWAIAGHPPLGGTGMGPVVSVPLLPLALGDGIRALTYTATDKAGNSSAGGNDIKIDTRGPVTEGAKDWVNGLEPYVLTATDQAPGSGVAATVYRVDQATPWSINQAAVVGPSLETTITLTGLQGSMHTIDFASVDAALPYWFDEEDWAEFFEMQNLPVPPSWHLGNWELDILNIAKTGAAFNSRNVKLDIKAPVTTVTPPALEGWYLAKPVTLVFEATDEGAGVDYTEYQVNGLGWVKGNSVAIQAEGETFVEYRSVDKVGIVEDIQSSTVRIDTVDPVTTVAASPEPNAAGWNSSAVTLTFTATDATSKVAKTEYSIDDGQNWTLVVDGKLVIDAAGVSTVMYRSTDEAGNEETAKTHTVKIDSAAPSTSVLPDTLEWHVTKPVTLTFTATPGVSEVAYTEYNVDDAEGNPTGWVKGQTVQINAEGETVVQYRSVSVAGVAEETKSTTVNIDTVDPVTTVAASPAPNAAGWNSSAVTLTFTATDATSGVDSTEYKLNDGDWTLLVDGQLVVEAEGVSTVMYRSTDKAGNVETAKTHTVKIDSAALSTIVTPDTSDWHVTKPITLTFTATPGVSGVAYTEYNVSESGWVKGQTVDINAEGDTVVQYRSVSIAGVVEETKSTTVNIDTVSPVTMVTGEVEGWSADPVTLTFSATDATSGVASTEYSTDNGSTWTPVVDNTLPVSAPGETTVWYRSADEAGNVEAAKTVIVRVDSSVPVTTVTGNDDEWHKTAVTLDFSAQGGIGGIAFTEWSIDEGANWTKGNSAIVSVNGETDVMYRSVSNAGVVETAKSVMVKVSTTRPNVTANNASVKRGKKATFRFTVDAVTPTATSVTIEIRTKTGKTLSVNRYANVPTKMEVSRSFKVNLKKGKYLIRVSAVDEAGNIQAKRGAGNLTVR